MNTIFLDLNDVKYNLSKEDREYVYEYLKYAKSNDFISVRGILSEDETSIKVYFVHLVSNEEFYNDIRDSGVEWSYEEISNYLGSA